MKRDLPWLEENRALIAAVARSYGLDPAVVAGLVSRESGGGRLLGKTRLPARHRRRRPRPRPDADRRPLAPAVPRHPRFLAPPGGQPRLRLLPPAPEPRRAGPAAARRHRGRRPAHRASPPTTAALSHALKCVRAGGDPDAVTTGGDFGRDVLDRAAWLRLRAGDARAALRPGRAPRPLLALRLLVLGHHGGVARAGDRATVRLLACAGPGVVLDGLPGLAALDRRARTPSWPGCTPGAGRPGTRRRRVRKREAGGRRGSAQEVVEHQRLLRALAVVEDAHRRLFLPSSRRALVHVGPVGVVAHARRGPRASKSNATR
ncbi:MAG: hypothetical protein MZV64_34785 [Ignavibacteriales bacterium]|nr:hypothetical protein [Ignavibacteriales bacterium]